MTTRGWVEAQRLEATTRGGRPVPRIEPQWGTYRPGRDRWVREELAATAMDVRASPLASVHSRTACHAP